MNSSIAPSRAVAAAEDDDPDQGSPGRTDEAGEDEARGGAHGPTSACDDPAVGKSIVPRVSGRDVGVMGGDDQRESVLLAQGVDEVEHTGAGIRVEMAGRFVAEQKIRALGQRAGDRDALGSPLRRAPTADCRASRRGRPARAVPGCAVAGVLEPPSPVCSRKGNVLVGGEAGKQVGSLKDVGDPVGLAPPRAPAASSEERGLPLHQTVPVVGSIRPPRAWSRVVLPDPERPQRASDSPRSIPSETAPRASMPALPCPWLTVSSSTDAILSRAAVAELIGPPGRPGARSRGRPRRRRVRSG